MTIDDMFESSIRSKGDLAGVFEYDGETGYFYLYATGNSANQKVVGAIRIISGVPDFKQTDVTVRWDGTETLVGLFICGRLCAAFDVNSGAQYGGNYHRDTQSELPLEILTAFQW